MGCEKLNDMIFKVIKFRNFIRRSVSGGLVVPSLILLLLSAVITVVLFSLFKSSLLMVEERAGYLPWTLFVDESLEERVTIVAIDEKSINEIGPWPWSRAVMADLVDSINAAGAQLQIHDVLYPVGDRQGDERFTEALLKGEKSIVAQLPVLQLQEPPLQSGSLTHAVTGIACDIYEQSGVGFPVTDQFVGTSDTLSAVPKGHIAPIIEADGAVRKVPAFICSNQVAYPALAITPFFQLASFDNWVGAVSRGEGLLEPEKILRLNSLAGLEVPLDVDGGKGFLSKVALLFYFRSRN